MSCVSAGERTTFVVDNKKRDDRDDNEKKGEKREERRQTGLNYSMAMTWRLIFIAMARSMTV